MKLTQKDVEQFFSVGDLIETGGRRSKFQIDDITDDRIHIQPKNGKTASRLLFNRLSVIIDSFNDIDPDNFYNTVGGILRKNKVRDEQNESYIYGFVREYIKRRDALAIANHKKLNFKVQSKQNTNNEMPPSTMPKVETLEEVQENLDRAIENSKKLSQSTRVKRLKNANTIPEKANVTTTVYKRNPDVIAEVLYNSKGKCGNCPNDAPFIRRKDGTPYLEVHHRIPLAKGGKDTVDNSIALCPNCHRKLHFG